MSNLENISVTNGVTTTEAFAASINNNFITVSGNTVTLSADTLTNAANIVVVSGKTANITTDQINAITGATGASASNVFATVDDINGVGVKVYKALITQIGTNAPTAVVLENTLGVIPLFRRNGPRDYDMYVTNGLFGNPKQFESIGTDSSSAEWFYRADDNTYNFGPTLEGSGTVINIDRLSVLIEVYP